MPTKSKPKLQSVTPQHTITDVNQPSPVRLQRAREMVLGWVRERREREAAAAAQSGVTP